MPKNTMNDPITGQERIFANLLMSGTMNDRRAAKAAGLNPHSASYIKAKPCVRAYMAQHSAAVEERLVDQEAEGLRRLNLGRDQILARLWELANLSPEATRGIIAGQIKALAMIVAIEGLIPDRRLSPPRNQPAAPPVKAEIYQPEWLRERQHQAESPQPDDAAMEAQPGAPQTPQPEADPETDLETPPQPAPMQANETSSSNLDRNHPSPASPFIHPDERMSWVPDAAGSIFAPDTTSSPRRPIFPNLDLSSHRR